MRVTRQDIISEIEDCPPEASDDFIFKNPVNYGSRVTRIKNKIYNATGILPHTIDILRVSISMVKAKLAWVTFSNKRIVSDIFRLAVQNGNQTYFNAFPHVPGKAMERKGGLETISKRLQGINNQLMYKIRLGDDDLEVCVKNHTEFDWKPYHKVEIGVIDPNGDIPKWNLTTSNVKSHAAEVNPFDRQKQAGK